MWGIGMRSRGASMGASNAVVRSLPRRSDFFGTWHYLIVYRAVAELLAKSKFVSFSKYHESFTLYYYLLPKQPLKAVLLRMSAQVLKQKHEEKRRSSFETMVGIGQNNL